MADIDAYAGALADIMQPSRAAGLESRAALEK